jgi:hypothetical protein
VTLVRYFKEMSHKLKSKKMYAAAAAAAAAAASSAS